MALTFASRTRDAWCALMQGSDACFTPVLDMHEAPGDPHNRARGTFTEQRGTVQPAPAPRFSRTSAEIRQREPQSAAAILAEYGFSTADIAALAPANR
jgi:alpha-methylacyl-CoA racemase